MFVESNIDQIANVFSASMAKLDDTGAYQYTGTDGVAKFNLKFVAGQPGPYILIFQSQTTRSDFSKTITLVNFVSAITLCNSQDENIDILNSEINNDYLLKQNLLINVTGISGGLVSGKSKSISIVVTSQEDVDKAYNILFGGYGSYENISLANITIAYNIVPDTTAFDQLSKKS